MTRRKSQDQYLVDTAWVKCFRAALGHRARLFVATFQDRVAATLLAMVHRPFVHLYLTGVNADLLAYSPYKILLNDVRQWVVKQGLSSFHLEGGLGAREGSLFRFKRRFSPLTHAFHVGCWIVLPREYRELEHNHRQFYKRKGIDPGNSEFFPVYRYRPTIEKDSFDAPDEVMSAAV